MPTDTEEPRTEEPQAQDPHPDYEHDHFEGGPVKTFLEHLEDLRWVLIKSLSAIGVAFVVLLLAGPQATEVLKYPLARAKIKHAKNVQIVSFWLGTYRLSTIQITPVQRA